MYHNTKLSTSAFLHHYISGKPIEFYRVGSQETKLKPLKVFGQDEMCMNFQWGSNEGMVPSQRPVSDIDEEISRILLQRGLFHLKDKIAIQVLPTKHTKLGAYTSYSSRILFFELEQVRP